MINPYILAGYQYHSIWSTRKANSTYGGPCMRVRRSSDNLAEDFYFSGTNLDTNSILSFVGSDIGYVDIWYDQAYSLVKRNMMKFSSTGLNVGTSRYWSGGGNVSATAGATTAPDGSVTAVRLNYTSTASQAIMNTTFFAVKKNTNYTFSIYAKSGTTSEIVLRISNGTTSVILVDEMKTTTGDWARYSVTVNTGEYNYIVCSIRNGYSFSAGQIGNVFVWGGQLEEGAVMTDFEPTEFKALRGFDLTGAGGYPTICSGGTINTVNGKPAIYFNGTGNYMQYFQYFGQFLRSDYYLQPIELNTIQKGSWSTYIVTKPTRLNHSAIQCLYGSDYNQGGGVRIGTFANIGANSTIPYSVIFSNAAAFLGNVSAGTGFTGNNQISSSYKSNVSATHYLDGISGTPFTVTASNDQSGYYGVGARIRNSGGVTEYYQGYIQEISHYCGYLEATREDYELAAKNYYII
jgi:hypothetical protein